MDLLDLVLDCQLGLIRCLCAKLVFMQIKVCRLINFERSDKHLNKLRSKVIGIKLFSADLQLLADL